MDRSPHCRTCNAPIVWLKTPSGKNMPVDAGSVEPDDDRYMAGKHVSHFATCPQAGQHRRRQSGSSTESAK
jgi:hypothetical protein